MRRLRRCPRPDSAREVRGAHTRTLSQFLSFNGLPPRLFTLLGFRRPHPTSSINTRPIGDSKERCLPRTGIGRSSWLPAQRPSMGVMLNP